MRKRPNISSASATSAELQGQLLTNTGVIREFETRADGKVTDQFGNIPPTRPPSDPVTQEGILVISTQATGMRRGISSSQKQMKAIEQRTSDTKGKEPKKERNRAKDFYRPLTQGGAKESRTKVNRKPASPQVRVQQERTSLQKERPHPQRRVLVGSVHDIERKAKGGHGQVPANSEEWTEAQLRWVEEQRNEEEQYQKEQRRRQRSEEKDSRLKSK